VTVCRDTELISVHYVNRSALMMMMMLTTTTTPECASVLHEA